MEILPAKVTMHWVKGMILMKLAGMLMIQWMINDCDVTEAEGDKPREACTETDCSMADHDDEADTSAEYSDEIRDFTDSCDESCKAVDDSS